MGGWAEGTSRIKNLEGVDTGFDFHLEEVDDGRGDFLHQQLKGGRF